MSDTARSSTPPYNYLYRVVRRNENYRVGIKAKNPNANMTVFDHVALGAARRSQYISTSASLEAAEDFAMKSWRYNAGMPVTIVRMNTANLTSETKFIDLTNSSIRSLIFNRHHVSEAAKNKRAHNCARKFEEVLVEGKIPAECVRLVKILEQNHQRS
ncbi:hypothetical protein ACF0H5_012146 [Mactra antiquata]